MDIKPLNRSKYQAGAVFAISFFIAAYYPQYIVQIYEVVGVVVAFISARWIILWRKWIDNGSPERRKSDLEHRVKVLEIEQIRFRNDRHQLREDMNKILGDVQVDIKDVQVGLKALTGEVSKVIQAVEFIANKVA